MLIITKSVLALMIGFILSIVFGYYFVLFMKKINASQRLSIYLKDRHKLKENTPTMGGFIFIVPTLITIIILYLLNKIDFSYNLLIVIFVLISYFIIGFLDDYLIIKRNNNKGLSETAKLVLQIITSIVFFYLFMMENEPLLWIHFLNLKINIGFLYGLFILFILVATSNAVNITDGLNGLAGGLSVIAFITYGLIAWNSGWLNGYDDIAIFCFVLVGSLMGFLIFNYPDAKIFMGDTGSLTLGALLGTIAILTRYELLLILVGIIFVLETTSSLLQRIYYKITKKRLFPMAPIHHTLEKMGYKEIDIVKLFWILGLIASMIAITFGVWL